MQWKIVKELCDGMGRKKKVSKHASALSSGLLLWEEKPCSASPWFLPCSRFVALCLVMCVAAGLVILFLLVYSVQSPFPPREAAVWFYQALVLSCVCWCSRLSSGWDPCFLVSGTSLLVEWAKDHVCPKPTRTVEGEEKRKYGKMQENIEETPVKPLNGWGKGWVKDERKLLKNTK